jgi:hypothetical protein
MVLYLIGLGLGDETDITVRGLECVRKCSRVYLEYYTSILGVDKAALEAYYGVPIVAADRYMVESEAEQMYQDCVTTDIAFLVVGDPLCATTHTDLILRARKIGAKVETIHNASVMAAVAGCGLQVGYSYRETTLLGPVIYHLCLIPHCLLYNYIPLSLPFLTYFFHVSCCVSCINTGTPYPSLCSRASGARPPSMTGSNTTPTEACIRYVCLTSR